jgi:leucyl aminopeptidase
VTILDPEDMQRLGMGALLAVARGSDEPARLIILDYNPGQQQTAPVVLVGKGVTFDTGGYSMKTFEGMAEMKSDMAGAAAVLATLRAVAELGLPLRVIGMAPSSENRINGRAYLPSDVLKAMNGKTIEVISTDAEGRLLLADALTYADRYHPQAVIDLATLTGAAVIALGANQAAGLFANNQSLAEALIQAAGVSGERIWQLPLFEEYLESIRTEVADVKNTGGRNGGVGTSAIFLREFIGSYPWAHLDIAPMAYSDRAQGYMPKGATGFGVRLLLTYLQRLAQSQ